MGTFTLNNIASDKANDAAKRGDAIRVRLDSIKIVDGFNIREDSDEVREHVAGIAGALAANLPIPAIEVWVNPETGAIELVDGHCRYFGYKAYAAETAGFDGYVSAVKFEGTLFQRKMRVASSNKQLKLKPIELGKLYLHARDVLNASRQEIAAEACMSLAHIDQHILLASGSEEIHSAVESGEISATEAVKMVRDFGADAPAELKRRKEVAKENGKERVTAKTFEPKQPKQPKQTSSNSLYIAAEVIVRSLTPNDLAICELPHAELVTIGSHHLADLIMAVREMQQTGKALDADKQMELIEE